jgi:hypothetical protein
VTAVLPSRLRRVVVILGYSLVSWFVVEITIFATQSTRCLRSNSACTPLERGLEDALGLLFVGLLAGWIIFGWTGRLWGARRTLLMPSQSGPTVLKE